MQYSSTLISLAFAAVTVSADTIKVAVGQNGLTYTPSDIKANVGDSVEFSFFPKNHTVTQSSFADPCHPLAGGFFSGFVPTPAANGSTFTITVQSQKPIWIYCGQPTGTHCQSGMVAAINAPATGNNTLEAFVALAKKASTSTSPPGGVAGGVLAIAGAAAVSSSNSGSNSSSTSSSSSAAGDVLTTAVITTIITTTVSNAQTTYATTYPSTITTATGVGAAGGSGGSGSPTGSSSSTSASPTGAANGLSANMVGVGAVILGALALV